MGRPARPFAADPPPDSDDFALPGPTGKSVARLLADALADGRAALESALRSAVARRLTAGVRTSAPPLFDDSERDSLAAALGRAAAAADLLGRARVARHAETVREKGRAHFRAADPLADLTTLPSSTQAALDYFLGLVPTLGIDPKAYGPLMERHAFTLAKATEETLLAKVQKALGDYLGTDWTDPAKSAGKPSGPRVVQAVLDRCGVTTANPQYAEMVFRTNVIDSFNAGVTRQMATPEMRADFPCWRYVGIEDGREGDDHRPKFGKVYPAHATFAAVRGPRVFNCRCTQIPMHASEVEEFRAAGGEVETRW